MSLFRARGDLVIKVFFQKGDDPFICAVNGAVTVDDLAKIEEELTSEDHEFEKGDGDYVFGSTYYSGQFDDLGRCEIAPGWELAEISFEPVKHDEAEIKCMACGKVNCGTEFVFDRCIPF